uniref:Uncharacterized protein n=1 Tax=Opuntia streptacantha TaxID=393608 RepID=A0A7C9EDP5_OPUST
MRCPFSSTFEWVAAKSSTAEGLLFIILANFSNHIVKEIYPWLCPILAFGPSTLFFLFHLDRTLKASSCPRLSFNPAQSSSVIQVMILLHGSFPTLYTLSFSLMRVFSFHSTFTRASCWGSYVKCVLKQFHQNIL